MPSEKMSIFLDLIKELPTDTVLTNWNGTPITVTRMAEELELDSRIGNDYVSDCIRVARDFLKRKARKI